MMQRVSGRGLLRGTAASLLLVIALSACMTEPAEPQLGTEETFDGLRAVSNARVSSAWIRPDLDLSGYRYILPVNAGIEYRPTKSQGSSRAGFPVPAANREKFESLVSEIFREELAKSQRFAITDKPGPDVLVVVGALIDVVSYVPPDPGGRNDVYLSQIGQATLVLELRDSESNAVLARIADRRAAEKISGMTPSNSVTNTAEVRRLIRGWASLLRQRLDDVASLTAADD